MTQGKNNPIYSINLVQDEILVISKIHFINEMKSQQIFKPSGMFYIVTTSTDTSTDIYTSYFP